MLDRLLKSEGVGWWKDIYTFLKHRIWICPQIHWSGTGPVGTFVITQSHYKWWENSHRTSSTPVNLGTNPDPMLEKSINSLPPAPHPHSSRASPTANILLPSAFTHLPQLFIHLQQDVFPQH